MMETVLKPLFRTGIRSLSAGWKPFSRLILAGDNVGWSLDWDMRELRGLATQLGIRTVSGVWQHSANPQAIFLAGQFFLADDNWLGIRHRVGLCRFMPQPRAPEPHPGFAHRNAEHGFTDRD
jgi:hypothetical protein